MTTSRTPQRANRPVRPLFGVRKKPGQLALGLFRMPLRAARAGHLPGTFVTFVHTGRKTGDPHESVAMVLRHDPATGEVVICAAWGPNTDWVRNLRVSNATRVQFGRTSFVPEQRFLADDEAVNVVREFCRHHPVRFRVFRLALGLADLRRQDAARAFVQTHPFVAFRPAF